MNCKKYRKMIFLLNELSDGERHKLEHHIHSCNSCKQLIINVKKTLPKFNETAKSAIQLSEKAGLPYQNIFQSLPEKSSGTFLNSITEILSFLFTPKMVKAFTTILLMFIISHEVYMVHKIVKLEQQISRLTSKNENTYTDMVYRSQQSKYILQNNQITLKEIGNYLEKEYNFSLDSEMIEHIFSKVPELKKITLKDGLAKTELQILAKHSGKIIQLYKNLILKGDLHV